MDLIGKTTRNEFREALVGFVLRDIEMFFDGVGLTCKEDYNPPLTGARRTLVEQYYASIDFSSQSDIKKLLAAYGEIILRMNRLARIHRWTGMDGVRTSEGGEGVTGAMIRARIWVDGR